MPKRLVKSAITGEITEIFTNTITRNKNYTFILAESSKLILYNSSSNFTWTIPPQSIVNWPNGIRIRFAKSGGGILTIARGSGVALYLAGGSTNANLSLAAGSYFSTYIEKLSDNVWILAFGSSESINLKVATFSQESEPTALNTGDLWTKTSTRQLYRWSGSAWVTQTASSVDDNADVTAANTAAAITGQGDLATTNEADANVLNMTNAPAAAGADVTLDALRGPFTFILTITIANFDTTYYGYEDSAMGGPYGSLSAYSFYDGQLNEETIGVIRWTVGASNVVELRLNGIAVANTNRIFSQIQVGAMTALTRSSATYDNDDGLGHTFWSWTGVNTAAYPTSSTVVLTVTSTGLS